MPIFVSEGSGGKQYPPAPAGSHAAVCCDVADLGMVETNYDGKVENKHMVRIYWQIAETREDGEPHVVSRRYTASLHERSGLRRDLSAWRGRDWTPEELKNFDLETIIGAPCIVSCVNVERAGKTYTNVASIMPLIKGMSRLTISPNYVRVKDRKPDEAPDGGHNEAPPPPPDDEPEWVSRPAF